MSNSSSISSLILVVDDNFINRQYFSMALKKQGYSVELAENGHDAINQSKKQSYDIIFMDIRMPEIDGYETAKQIKSLPTNINTPIIATSAEKNELCGKQIFVDFILKPISPTQLKDCVKKHSKQNNQSNNNTIIFDKEYALKYAYNDKKIMEKLNALFIQDFPIQLKFLSESFNHKNTNKCIEIIHKLRGSCLICGALDLDKKFENLSQLLKNDNITFALKQFEIIKNYQIQELKQ